MIDLAHQGAFEKIRDMIDSGQYTKIQNAYHSEDVDRPNDCCYLGLLRIAFPSQGNEPWTHAQEALFHLTSDFATEDLQCHNQLFRPDLADCILDWNDNCPFTFSQIHDLVAHWITTRDAS